MSSVVNIFNKGIYFISTLCLWSTDEYVNCLTRSESPPLSSKYCWYIWSYLYLLQRERTERLLEDAQGLLVNRIHWPSFYPITFIIIVVVVIITTAIIRFTNHNFIIPIKYLALHQFSSHYEYVDKWPCCKNVKLLFVWKFEAAFLNCIFKFMHTHHVCDLMDIIYIIMILRI